MDLPSTIQSSPSATTQNSPYPLPAHPHPHNPYARISSRRAIACVTCAKAKTKCDKALPSCSRCITKGIKCEPRSTRRTSDNSYRANVKKPFVSPKRYHSSNTVPTLSRHTSPRSIPTGGRNRIMRAASHIDFRTAVKMSQQASGISGYPMLTPLPTYASQIVNECYSYSSSPEQNLDGFTQAMEPNSLPMSGRLTPQTPEATIYHEPLSMGESMDPYMTSQPWADDGINSVAFGLEPDMAMLLPADMWSAREAENMMPVAHLSWPPPTLSASPQQMAPEMVSHPSVVPSLATSECSVEDFNPTGTGQSQWSIYQPTASPIHMASMATSGPFMHSMKPVSGHAPIWEDVFIPSPSSY